MQTNTGERIRSRHDPPGTGEGAGIAASILWGLALARVWSPAVALDFMLVVRAMEIGKAGNYPPSDSEQTRLVSGMSRPSFHCGQVILAHPSESRYNCRSIECRPGR